MLRNSEGNRFMFDYVPEMYRDEFADTEEEALAWVQEVISDKQATNRRPPELLTRDVVAKAINSEKAAGRASEHGGVPEYILAAGRSGSEEIAWDVSSIQGACRSGHNKAANGSRANSTLCDGRCKGRS